MKHLLLIGFLVAIYVGTKAQDGSFPMKAGKVHYEIVDSSFRNKTKAQLYSMSKLWLLDQFYEVKSFLEIDNPDDGLIAGRLTLPQYIKITGLPGYKCSFSFVIISKDGKFKAQFYNFQFTYTGTDYEESFPLEQFLEPAMKEKDNKKALPKLEGQVYGLMRSIQFSMESIYTLMDF